MWALISTFRSPRGTQGVHTNGTWMKRCHPPSFCSWEPWQRAQERERIMRCKNMDKTYATLQRGGCVVTADDTTILSPHGLSLFQRHFPHSPTSFFFFFSHESVQENKIITYVIMKEGTWLLKDEISSFPSPPWLDSTI